MLRNACASIVAVPPRDRGSMWDSGSTHSGKFFGPGSGFLRITFLLLRGTFVVQRGIEGLWSVVRASDSPHVSRLRSAARRSPLAALSPLLVPAGRIPWHRPSGSPSGSTHYPRQALRPDPTDPSEARRPCIPAADCLQCAGYIFIIASPRQGRYFNYPSPTACPPLAVLTPSAPAAWSVCDGRS